MIGGNLAPPAERPDTDVAPGLIELRSPPGLCERRRISDQHRESNSGVQLARVGPRFFHGSHDITHWSRLRTVARRLAWPRRGMTEPGASTPTLPPAIAAIVSHLAAAKRTCGLARRGGDRQGLGLAEARPARSRGGSRTPRWPCSRRRPRRCRRHPGPLAAPALPRLRHDPGADGPAVLLARLLADGARRRGRPMRKPWRHSARAAGRAACAAWVADALHVLGAGPGAAHEADGPADPEL